MNNKFYFVSVEKTTENKVSNIGFHREVINYLTTQHPLIDFNPKVSDKDKIINNRVLFFSEIEQELYHNIKAMYPEGN